MKTFKITGSLKLLCAAAILSFGLTACGQPSAEESADKLLNSMEKGYEKMMEKMSSMYSAMPCGDRYQKAMEDLVGFDAIKPELKKAMIEIYTADELAKAVENDCGGMNEDGTPQVKEGCGFMEAKSAQFGAKMQEFMTAKMSNPDIQKKLMDIGTEIATDPSCQK